MRCFLASYLNGGDPVSINALPRQLRWVDTDDYLHHAIAPWAVRDMSHVDTLLLRGAVLLHLSVLANQRPALVKTHHINAVVDGFELIPPQMTEAAIYVVRDPRDVAVSLAAYLGKSIDQAIDYMSEDDALLTRPESDMGKPIHHILSSWSNHVDSWLKLKRPLCFVRYEDLHEGRGFREIVQTMGLELDEVRLRKAVRSSSFEVLKDQEDQGGFIENASSSSFFRGGEVGGWQTKLTPGQINRIVAEHGPAMERMGYLPGG